ncbi:CHAD domain-containing protein [Photobacterium sp. SDRW27]|uniref:CHAD domain-containing protein n=1 Tax=Photobacterium obscurum TaxID=2829490 RepID=UPI00224322F5|nr:CHAD domain-containing protein [Photobacterium obscurum]MCW8330246.1 CHAD domain-containing protein [Photobacterium obscurum]
MNVNKRDQLKFPKRKKNETALSAKADIYLPTIHFLRAEFKHARQHEKGIIRDDHCEFLHQYRVALRRCLTLLCLLSPLFASQPKKMLENELKTMMLKTNRLRELDIFLFKMDDCFYCLEHKYHQGLTCFFDELQDERRKAYKELKKWLKMENYEQQCLLVEGLLSELDVPSANGNTSCQSFAKQIIWKHFSHIHKLCNELNSKSPDSTVHQLHISCNKLGYLMDYFTPLFPSKENKTLVHAIKQLEDEIGNFNDSSIQLNVLGCYLKKKKENSHRNRAIAQLVDITQQHHIKFKQQMIKQTQRFASPANVNSFQAIYCIEK